jgi:hypothetical protein
MVSPFAKSLIMTHTNALFEAETARYGETRAHGTSRRQVVRPRVDGRDVRLVLLEGASLRWNIVQYPTNGRRRACAQIGPSLDHFMRSPLWS